MIQVLETMEDVMHEGSPTRKKPTHKELKAKGDSKSSELE